MRQRHHDDVRRPRAAAFALISVLVLGVTAACSNDAPDPAPQPTPTAPARVTELTFGVWGAKEEVTAYQALVDDYNGEHEGVNITMVTWPSHQAFAQSLARDTPAQVPDIYLVSRGDLAQLQADLGQRCRGTG